MKTVAYSHQSDSKSCPGNAFVPENHPKGDFLPTVFVALSSWATTRAFAVSGLPLRQLLSVPLRQPVTDSVRHPSDPSPWCAATTAGPSAAFAAGPRAHRPARPRVFLHVARFRLLRLAGSEANHHAGTGD
jgi:hypothetical protein